MSGYDPILGFQKKTYSEILADMQAGVRADLGEDLALDGDDPIGQVLAIAANEAAEQWEVGQVCFDALDPTNAEGRTLHGVAALTGTAVLPATYSIVPVNCTLVAGTTLLAGDSKVNPPGRPTVTFQLSSAFTAPTTGVHTLTFRATLPGPVEALAGELTAITVPVAGWSAATNPSDAERGQDEETDPDLRLRRVQELSAAGSASVDAVQTDLLRLMQPIFADASCTVVENTRLTDYDGIEPKAIAAVVYDGAIPQVADAAIASQLWKSRSQGISTTGDVVVSVADTQGETHEVKFSRAQQLAIFYEVEVQYIPTQLTTPEQVAAYGLAIKKAIVDANAARRVVGVNVTRDAVFEAIRKVPGHYTVSRYACAVGAAPPPGETVAPIVVSRTQIAIVDSVNVTVMATPAGEV